MLNEMRVNDEQLETSDIRQLESADEIAHFFARLHYDGDERTNIPDYTMLGMGSEDMRQHIRKIELIGKDPEDMDWQETAGRLCIPSPPKGPGDLSGIIEAHVGERAAQCCHCCTCRHPGAPRRR
jgi:hypothetical protein